MCKQIIEKYTVCGCTYWEHPVDRCSRHGSRGHKVRRQEVLVGHSCTNHSRSSLKPIKSVSKRGKLSGDTSDEEHTTVRSGSLEDPPDPVSERNRNESGKVAEASQRGSLRTNILSRIEQYRDRNLSFAASADFQQLISTRSMASELGIPDTGDAGLTERRQIFAILLLADSLDLFWSLYSDGVKDMHLPLTDEKERYHPALYRSVLQWSPGLKQKIYFHQWTLLVPKSSESQHVFLSQDQGLPFTRIEQIGEGAFGSVWKAKIDKSWESSPRSRDLVPGSILAVKVFSDGSSDANRRAFQMELQNLKHLENPKQFSERFVMSLASFECAGHYHILFPLADQNLRQFWHANSPSPTMNTYCLRQMTGLMHGLASLHGNPAETGPRAFTACHYDLKPENILIFGGHLNEVSSTWKIGDFGLSCFSKKSDASSNTDSAIGFGTYEPPECQLALNTSTAFDIWSIGCVFLECVAFLFGGAGAVEAFADNRLSDTNMTGVSFVNDYFFFFEDDEHPSLSTTVTRPSVLSLIKHLGQRKDCTYAIALFLDTIKDGMLQVDQHNRLRASQTYERCSEIIASAEDVADNKIGVRKN